MKFQTKTGSDIRRENICFTFYMFRLGGFYPNFSSINIPQYGEVHELQVIWRDEWNGTMMTNVLNGSG